MDKELFVIKMILVVLLYIQIYLVAWSLSQLANGNATALTYFNIILNTVFGALNVYNLMRD